MSLDRDKSLLTEQTVKNGEQSHAQDKVKQKERKTGRQQKDWTVKGSVDRGGQQLDILQKQCIKFLTSCTIIRTV